MRGQHNIKAPYVVNTDRRVGLGNILLQHVAVLISVDIIQIIITGTTDYRHTIMHIINTLEWVKVQTL